VSKDKASMFLHYWRILAGDKPEPEPEYPFSKVLKRRHRFDFAWPDERIAVEVEGNAWTVKGGGRHMRDSDLEKYNLACHLRWLVFRFSPGMLERDPQSCIDLVVQALEDGA